MKKNVTRFLILLTVLFIFGVDTGNTIEQPISYQRTTKTITYNNIEFNVVIDKPDLKKVDVLIIFHGTVKTDSNIIPPAKRTLDKFKNLLDKQDMMIISVAYPQHNILFGDNIIQAEAPLLWVKHRADKALDITINKIFLAGHSQGGYIVTRLNTMHQTDGVIANAPGPLNLVFRCKLEETGKTAKGYVCNSLRQVYGTTTTNPDAYFQRSLLNFTGGFKSDILFVQGLNDKAIQMKSWQSFKQNVLNCTDCHNKQFVEVTDAGHEALFESSSAKTAFNNFINNRCK
ncbi:MAG: hypothetical protein CR988_05360 [Treponema sp.]|nr:MAG: hypothetical protein CR988_05360 [Treponema sp.]